MYAVHSRATVAPASPGVHVGAAGSPGLTTVTIAAHPKGGPIVTVIIWKLHYDKERSKWNEGRWCMQNKYDNVCNQKLYQKI